MDCASADNSCQGPSLNTSDSTVHKTASIFSINYGIGHVSGSVYTTPLTLDGLTVPALNIGVSLIEASLPSQQGILGLGFPPLSDIKRSGAPGVSTMMDAGVNTFGVFLSRAGQDGEITLGGADPKRYKGAATYIPLSAETYWQVAFAGATMSLAGNTSGPNGAGEALAIDLAGGLTDAILDTGTTYVMVTSAVAAAVAKLVDPTSDGFTVSCTTNKDVVLRFGGAAFALPAEGYMVDNGDGTCGTVFVGGAPGIAILGEAFLRYWYTLFDGPGRRIGLAQANHA
ncbi:hypothetical protein HK101_004062 [Irineochytrium annulatum]|nr:hypothetical protein HK101_004062 [Irineochytrium annulatum]